LNSREGLNDDVRFESKAEMIAFIAGDIDAWKQANGPLAH
jgi:hypothetical protein